MVLSRLVVLVVSQIDGSDGCFFSNRERAF